MRALLIDEKSKESVAKTMQYAEDHRYSRPYLLALMNGSNVSAPGDDPGHCCYFFEGFKSVFTIEEQPMGWSRHISISVADIEKVPHIEAVKMIMKEFGFDKPLEECHVYIEDSFPKSINIICQI